MFIIAQLFTFCFILYLILVNLRSVITELEDNSLSPSPSSEGSSSFSSSLSSFSSSYFSPYNSIIIRQQLKSRLPNFNEPLRDIRLGSLNFLHTTDTHGWYMGHTNQKQYSSDWGDFVSFQSNLKKISNDNNGDLLTIDTGDRHDGNGLSDLTNPKGELSTKVFMMADYDLITLGNHEMYSAEISKFEFENVLPRYGESFISTNVEYLNDNNDWVIFGNSTHRYFETEINKYKILSLSFMFEFLWSNERVRVTPISEIIKQNWLASLLTDYAENYEIDTLVIFGHMPVTQDWTEFVELHIFIRKFFPNTYIQYFGGHSHIRDFSILDNLSSGLQSGRYCETIGFLSIQNLPVADSSNLDEFIENNIDRKYLDFNLHSFMHHTNNTNLDSFNTEKGLFVSQQLSNFNDLLGLDESYGKVPQNYYMSAANYKGNDKHSLLRFLENDVLVQLEPKICDLEKDQGSYVNDNNNSRIIIINTGSIRYDLYKGDFTKNSLFTVSPFENKWKIIPSVPSSVALKIKDILNNGDFILENNDLKSPHQRALEKLNNANLIADTHLMNTVNLETDEKLRAISYGYTTKDDLGIGGDDTIHKKLPNFWVPNVIQSHEKSFDQSNDLTDVVFYDFIEPHILSALKGACGEDVELYQSLASNITFYNDCSVEFNLGQLLKKYAIQNWN